MASEFRANSSDVLAAVRAFKDRTLDGGLASGHTRMLAMVDVLTSVQRREFLLNSGTFWGAEKWVQSVVISDYLKSYISAVISHHGVGAPSIGPRRKPHFGRTLDQCPRVSRDYRQNANQATPRNREFSFLRMSEELCSVWLLFKLAHL